MFIRMIAAALRRIIILKSPEEMTLLFRDLPEALENTVEIARRCAFRPRFHDPILPRFVEAGG